MSTILQTQGAATSVGKALTTTAQTTIYTQGEGAAAATNLRVTNKTTTAATITATWFDNSDGGGTEYTFLSAKSISGNTSEDIDLNGLRLDKDDEIRATAGTANALDCILTVARTAGRSGS